MREAAYGPGASWRGGDSPTSHGILLRVDLHQLLDDGLLRIEAGVVRGSVGGYRAFVGTVLRKPQGDVSVDGGGVSRSSGGLRGRTGSAPRRQAGPHRLMHRGPGSNSPAGSTRGTARSGGGVPASHLHMLQISIPGSRQFAVVMGLAAREEQR